MKQTIDITIGEIQTPQIELIATSPRGPVGPQGIPGQVTPTSLHSGSAFINISEIDKVYAGNTTNGLSEPIINNKLEGNSIESFKQNNFIHCPVDTNLFNLYASYTGGSNNSENFKALLYLVLENGEGSVAQQYIAELNDTLATLQQLLETLEVGGGFDTNIEQAQDHLDQIDSYTEAISNAQATIAGAQMSIDYNLMLTQIEAIETLLGDQLSEYPMNTWSSPNALIDAVNNATIGYEALLGNSQEAYNTASLAYDDAAESLATCELNLAELAPPLAEAESAMLTLEPALVEAQNLQIGITSAISTYTNAYDNFGDDNAWYVDLQTGLAGLHDYGPQSDNLPADIYDLQVDLIEAQAAVDASSSAQDGWNGLNTALDTAQDAYDDKVAAAITAMDYLFIFADNPAQNTELNTLLAAALFTPNSPNQVITIAELMDAIIDVPEIQSFPTNNSGYITWVNNINDYTPVYADYIAIEGLQDEFDAAEIEIEGLQASIDEHQAVIDDTLLAVSALEFTQVEQQTLQGSAAETMENATSQMENYNNLISSNTDIVTQFIELIVNLSGSVVQYNQVYSTTINAYTVISSYAPEDTSLTQEDITISELAISMADIGLEGSLVFLGNTYESIELVQTALGVFIEGWTSGQESYESALNTANQSIESVNQQIADATSDLGTYGLLPVHTFEFSPNSPRTIPGRIQETLDLDALELPEDYSTLGARFLLGWQSEIGQQYKVSYTLTAN